MDLEPKIYKPSGKLGTGIFLVPLAGILTSILAGIAYGFINRYNPLIYVQFIVTGLFGVAIAWVIGRAAILSKCRNPLFAGLVGMAGGALGLYFAWAALVFSLVGQSGPAPGLTDWLASPGALWEFVAEALAPNGWYTLRRWTPTGFFLWVAWSIEAIIVLGASAGVAYFMVEEKVFCETCGEWCAASKDAVRAEGTPKEEIITRLKAGDLGAMAELPPPQAAAPSFFRLDHQLCGKCGNMGAYKIVQVALGKDKEGKDEIKETELSAQVLLTPESARQLGELMARDKVAKPTMGKPFADQG